MPSASRRGFTLVEIMVVVIIIGIVAGAIVPNLAGSMGGIRLETGAQRIAALMDYCYNAACSTGKVHGLIFSPDGREFQVVSERPQDENSDPEAPPELGEVSLPGLIDRTLPEGVRLSSVDAYEGDLVYGDEEQTRILFFPDGTTEFATLELSDDKGDSRHVGLNGLSGTITISNPALEPPEEAESEQVVEQ